MAKPVLSALRAHLRCEYCLVHEDEPYHVDHIISEQHDGETELPNVAYSCNLCNWHKGPNIATFDQEAQMLIPLFNPRTDHWEAHFALQRGVIVPQARVGEATARILRLNDSKRLTERARLISRGRYPRI